MIRKVRFLHLAVSLHTDNSSCHRRCHSIFIRCQGYCRSLDLHKRVAIWSTILAHQDTYLHLPTWLVPMADRMDTRIPTLSIRRSQHQRLEQLLLDSDSTGWRAGHICLPLRARNSQQTWETKGSHGGEEGQIDMTKAFQVHQKVQSFSSMTNMLTLEVMPSLCLTL